MYVIQFLSFFREVIPLKITYSCHVFEPIKFK